MKPCKIFKLFFLAFVILVSSSLCSEAKEIGDFGEAGIIFYQYQDGTFLEAASEETEVRMQWQISDLIGDEGYTVYEYITNAPSSSDGKQNTQKIFNSRKATPAASYCAKLNHNSKNDFYLPSIEELKIMYYSKELSLFLMAAYWSSTEVERTQEGQSNSAWALSVLNGGGIFTLGKGNARRVRCIRKFK